MARLASRSLQLYHRARLAIPGGVNSPIRYYPPYPMFVAKAKGSRFHSIDGREYLDYCMAYGALIHGHSNVEVVKATQAAVANGSIYGQPTEAEVELAELISSLMPSMQMVRLVNSGTEATMHVLRLARGFTGKSKILKFEGEFHGSHDSVLVKTGPRGSILGVPSSDGVLNETARNTLVGRYNDRQSAEKIIEDHGSELAAVIVEPVAGNMGLIPPTRGFLDSLRRVTRRNGVMLVFDEVITGFRLSLGGAQELYNIRPDLTTLGKIVGGGLPLAAFGGRREIMRKLAPLGPVYQAGTYSGNPVSVTAGLTTLRSLKRRSSKLYPRLERSARFLSRGIQDHLESHAVAGQVNQIGSMFQTFFTERPVTSYTSAKSSDMDMYSRYFRSLLESKIFVPPSQLETCFLSTAHQREDLQLTLDAVDHAMGKVRR
jgi:glutamate-1-semialdehyde 2,1-aminomutase